MTDQKITTERAMLADAFDKLAERLQYTLDRFDPSEPSVSGEQALGCVADAVRELAWELRRPEKQP